jgi:cellobiose phosphorylase
LTAEQLIAHARELAALHGAPGPGGRNRLLTWLRDSGDQLEAAVDELAQAAREGRRLSPAGVWLVDNRHLLRTQVATVHKHLPRSYSRRLPQLQQGSVAGLPRVFVVVCDYIAHVDGCLNEDTLRGFIAAYQESRTLLLGELWATPIMLRLGLIGNLSRLAQRVLAMHQQTVAAGLWADRLISTAEEHPAGLVVDLGRMVTAIGDPSTAFVAELRRRLRGHHAVLGLISGWLDARPGERPREADAEELRHTRSQVADQFTAEVTITSLRGLDEIDWRAFVESISAVERELRRDPAGIHPLMDEATRDSYRHAVERLARRAKRDEAAIAQAAVAQATGGSGVAEHVGHWLVGDGCPVLELAVGLRRTPWRMLRWWYHRHGEVPYSAAVLALSAVAAGGIMLLAWPVAWPAWLAPLLALSALITLSQPAVQFVAWCHGRWLTPVRLPRLDLSRGITYANRTLVAVPTMLRRREDAASLAEGLELRYLANPDADLRFALLSDFADAPRADMPDDEELLDATRRAIRALNERYGSDGIGPFVLLHRPRRLNPAEGCWMGWERKRGKIEHLNALLRHGERQHFSVIDGDPAALRGVRYVIVLDTDTVLPPGSARRLVATMAHPLNHPRHAKDGRVIAGHALMQPRVMISSTSAVRSIFARFSAPEPGIDAYSGVSADLWQDLCGEGSFVGKGIYDLAAFDRAIAGRFPENTILSHDLIEGCFARSALVSDVALVEDQPASLLADRVRRHRWMRGDWQIAGWLLPVARSASGAWVRNRLSHLSRLKIIDNLRRALVPPLALALVLVDLLAGSGGLALVALVAAWLVTPLLANTLALLRHPPHVRWRVHVATIARRFGREVAGVALGLALLPAEATLALHAAAVVSWRMLVSGRKRLEWLTSSEAERLARSDVISAYRALWACPAAVAVLAPVLGAETAMPRVIADVLAVMWLSAPLVAWWMSRPIIDAPVVLLERDQDLVAKTARATWRWFETFVNEQERWLPPDNVQEHPVVLVAHRTSPTNMGMALLADLAANDLGYLPLPALLDRGEAIISAIERLERHRGHFYNWYDTSTSMPLPPRYISTVDSGNLASALLVLVQGLIALDRRPLDPATVTQGLRHVNVLLEAACTGHAPARGIVADLARKLMRVPEPVAAADHFSDLATWLAAQEQVLSPAGEEARWWLQAAVRQAQGWSECYRQVGWGRGATTSLLAAAEGAEEQVSGAIRLLSERAHRLAARAEALVDEMDFSFLYHRQRRLFAIGMQVDEGRLDRSCYDLLASEARLTSYLAVARGQAPLEHWFALGRPLTEVEGQAALVSWSGSMFEYLMPDLLMPEFPGTLLALSQRAMLQRQIAYGHEQGVPWGISESGYHLTDAAQQWQYRGFGVPGLGLKQGLADDLVVAPYASALALLIDPQASAANLRRLHEEGMFGRYGFYESVDYTPTRLPPGTTRAPVRSWMVHHQGMILLSCLHVLAASPMRARFRADPHLRALELLLQERAPLLAPFDEPGEEPRRLTPAEEAAGAHVVANPNVSQIEATLLSNGRYQVLITAAGGGVSRWRGHQLNRWHEDALSEGYGLFCYLHDVERGHRWSNTYQPMVKPSRSYEALFTQAKAEFRRRDHDIDCTTEISVSSEDDVELRRVTLVNRSAVPRTIELTSCAELVVGSGDADVAHQAFSGLALTTRVEWQLEALLCRRRPRRSDERLPVALHLMTVHGAEYSSISVETDRWRFVGRGRSLRDPAALDRPGLLSGSVGNVLDAIAALRRRILLVPGTPVVVDMVWGFAADDEAALMLARRYRDRALTDRVAGLAWGQARLILHQLGVGEEVAQAAARLVSALIAPQAARRAPAGVVALNRRPQSALWAYGISGDLPIVILRVSNMTDLDVVRDALMAHTWWRIKGLPVDLVLWNEDPSGYRQELHERLVVMVEQSQPTDGRPGMLVLRRADQTPDEDRLALLAAARVVLEAANGSFTAQAARRARPPRPVELLQPPRSPRSRAMSPAPIPESLAFANGLGGFDRSGAYVVVLDPSASTPAPWINVLANPRFGSVVSATGASCTWAENCHEYRITPWPADAIEERCGEALFLRDEEDGGYWSPSQWPAAAPARYITRHAFGSTTFTCHHDDLISELTTFVAANEPVRVWAWRLTNRGERVRRLSLTWCGELVLGETRRRESGFVVTALDPVTGGLTARNPHHPDLGLRTVALDVNVRGRHVSGDRATVLGRNRGWDKPDTMQRAHLDGRTGACLDPCLAMQVPVELGPGQSREVVFTLACGGIEDAASLAARWCSPGVAAAGLAAATQRWDSLCGAVQVSTPDRATDLLVNRWLPYQTIACRMWARGAFYQSGGAFGFRDQLQDAMALVHNDPRMLRDQILLAASRQFVEGDVQHWWHPPAGRGVRTRCSDDLLWLPVAVARYIAATGDFAVLYEEVSFLAATRPLPEEGDLYEQPLESPERSQLYDHCLRAIQRSRRLGAHGLPLIGSGDWNDGFDRLGHHGRGESVWLAFFLHHVITEFLPLMRSRGDNSMAEELAAWDRDLLRAADEAWDGAWYRRAYDDDGQPVGSASNRACRIDSLPQSWAVIAGTPDRPRAVTAMASVERELVDHQAGLVKLFKPPFGENDGDPGYIRGYPDGIRENGGQYTHAAVWVAIAYARLGDAERAWAVARLIDPIRRGADPRRQELHRTEPYVLCGDIYACEPWTGRGGWSWYTGSAGWMYRLMLEELLGIRLDHGHLLVEPLLPQDWPGFTATYRRGTTTWTIAVTRGERSTTVDGEVVADHRIALGESGRNHRVEVARGVPAAQEERS